MSKQKLLEGDSPPAHRPAPCPILGGTEQACFLGALEEREPSPRHSLSLCVGQERNKLS